MKKIQFNKIVMVVMLAVNIVVCAYVLWLMKETGDLSPAPYLLMGEGGAVSVCIGSYAWKERSANNLKIGLASVKEIADKYNSIDAAIRLAEVVLQE